MRRELRGDGVNRIDTIVDQCGELLDWLTWLQIRFPDASAIELVAATRASLLEACAYSSLGLARAAISALRTSVDTILSFTYFSEHHVEWDIVNDTGNGFMLRSHIDAYHKNRSPLFGRRIDLLNRLSDKSLNDLYRIMSAHIHAQSLLTIPRAGRFEDLVANSDVLDSLSELQGETVRATSDYLAAVYATDVMTLPDRCRHRLARTLNAKQHSLFFEQS